MDSALLTVVVTTGTEPLVDPPGPIAVPLAPALMRYCERIDAGDPHTPAYTSGLAQAYVDSDGTCDDAADVEAYQRLSAEVRARLRDDRAAVLTARDEPSLLIGAVPYHREHGSDPAAGPRALHHAQDWCMDHGYYHAVVDLGLRGLALTDEDTDVDEWWAFTTRMTTALAALGRPDEALALYDEVRTRTTAAGVHMQAAYATAMLYTRQFEGDRRDHQRARAWINQAVGIASILPDAKQRAFNTAFNRNGLALIEFHQGKPDAALSLLDECIADLAKALAPGEQVLHRSVLRYNRAQVYAALGRLADAVEDYSAVIEQDPNYAEYYFDRAAIYRRLGRHAEARADYDQAIRLSPPFPEAYYNRGDLRAELGDTDGAFDDFSYTLELDPDFVDAYVNRAAIEIDRGSLADAERDAVAGLARDVDNPHLHVVLGQVQAEREQYAGAQVAFDQAIAADPDLVTALAGRAALAYQTGELDRAIADLRRAVDLRPDDAALRYNLAFLHQSGGQWALALLYLERAAELAPDDPDISAARRLCLDHLATA
jgi:tetratricopeptide (TPR) repeat protein